MLEAKNVFDNQFPNNETFTMLDTTKLSETEVARKIFLAIS